MLTLEKLKEEIKDHKNTLVLDFFQVVRLVDVTYDEDDFYWVYDTHKGIKHSTCCVGYTPLKGYITEDKYNKLVNFWNLNNVTPSI